MTNPLIDPLPCPTCGAPQIQGVKTCRCQSAGYHSLQRFDQTDVTQLLCDLLYETSACVGDSERVESKGATAKSAAIKYLASVQKLAIESQTGRNTIAKWV